MASCSVIQWVPHTASPAHACPRQVAPPSWFAAHILGHPSRLTALFNALIEAFEFDQSAGALLLHAPPEAGAAYEAGKLRPDPKALQPQPGQQHTLQLADGGPQFSSSGSSRAVATAAVALQGGGAAAPLLPRMPLGLALIQTSKAYEAVAGVCRAAAAVAAAAGGSESEGAPGPEGGTALRRLVDHGLRRLQQLLEGGAAAASDLCKPARSKQNGGELAAAAGPAAAATQPWQLQAAAVAAVLSEMLFGASPARQQGGSAADCSASERQRSEQGGAVPTATEGRVREQEGEASRELQALVLGLVEPLVGGALWSLPTWQQQPQQQQGGSENPSGARLSAQQLGVNVMAVRVAVEAVGTCGRLLGLSFARWGRLLRTALLPLLERLGEGGGQS